MDDLHLTLTKAGMGPAAPMEMQTEMQMEMQTGQCPTRPAR